MKLQLATAATLLALSTGLAFAQATTEVAGVPDGCKAVTVARDNIDANRNEVHLTFKGYGSDVESIRACNPASFKQSNVIGVTKTDNAGSRVSIRTKNGAGVVGLPVVMAAGEIEQIVCDLKDDKVVYQLYYVDWDGGLKNNLKAVPKEATRGDDATHLAGCEKSRPPSRRVDAKKLTS